MDFTSSPESDTKSPDQQERENKHKQDEMFVYMARIIRISMKQYFIKCLTVFALNTAIIPALTREHSETSTSWTKRFHDLYIALKHHRPLKNPSDSDKTEIALRKALHVSCPSS